MTRTTLNLKPLQKLAVGLVIVSALLASTAQSQTITEKPLQKVTIAIGALVIDSSLPWLTLPLALGYWKKEGYDVEIFPTGGSLQALQQLVGGNAQFAQVNSAALIQINAVSNVPARVLMANGIIDWALIVPEDSPVKRLGDLKGKKIGVPSLGTGGIPLLRSFFRANGVDPDKDIALIPIGIGTSALEALRSDKVQAGMYWGGMIVKFENNGEKFRKFRDPSWDTTVDYTFTALQPIIDNDPKMVEAIVRGANMGTVFAMANPDCARKLEWDYWPSTKPTGADEATLIRWDLNYLNAQLSSMRAANQAFGGGKFWGKPTIESYAAMQDFLFDAKVIDKKVDPASFIIKVTNFYENTNRFDQDAVVAQAKACRIQ
jgi:NitT/TauT family transport system substrate-binding protein